MNQIIEQTNDEKAEMYMKLEKIEIIDMLIEANRLLDIKNLNLHDINKCAVCGSDDLFNIKLEHIKCRNCDARFEHGC